MIQISNIYPLIVPISYFQKDIFDLPHYVLPCKDFIVCWVTFENNSTMSYLMQDNIIYLDKKHKNWKGTVLRNLNAPNGEYFIFTHEKRNSSGQLTWVAFMNEDGIGSSRLLLTEDIAEIFPEGYYLAIPERSCGIAISVKYFYEVENEIADIIQACYRNGNTPISDKIFKKEDFEVPKHWKI